MDQGRSVRQAWSVAKSYLRSRGVGEERRRHPRQPVSWTVQLWLAEDVFAIGRAANASLHGICVIASKRVGAFLKPGVPYSLEVHAGTDVLACTGEIRNVDERGIGFEVRESLPCDVIAMAAREDRLPDAGMAESS